MILLLILPVPDPSVSVTRNGGATLFAGIVLTLTCEITVTGIPTAMLRNVIVSVTWIGAGEVPLMSDDKVSITGAIQNPGTNSYISTVEIDTLITGTYTCRANIIPSASLTFIVTSNATDGSITLDIQREWVFFFSYFVAYLRGVGAYICNCVQ